MFVYYRFENYSTDFDEIVSKIGMIYDRYQIIYNDVYIN